MARSTYIEKKADNSHNLLLVEEIEDFGDVLDDVELEVGESLDGFMVGGDNVQGAHNVVGDLAILNALVLEKLLVGVEATVPDEELGELVSLEQEHHGVGEGVGGKFLLGTGLEQVVHEFVGVLSAVLVLVGLDKDREHVGSQVSLFGSIRLSVLDEVGEEDVDEIHVFLSVPGLLDVDEVLDTGALVLEDTVDEGEGEVGELGLGVDVLQDGEEHAEEVLDAVLGVKVLTLGNIAGFLELLESLEGALGERVVAV